MNDCPAEDCTTQTGDRKFLCRRHWSLVPRALRDDLRIAYRGAGHEPDVAARRRQRERLVDAAALCIFAAQLEDAALTG